MRPQSVPSVFACSIVLRKLWVAPWQWLSQIRMLGLERPSLGSRNILCREDTKNQKMGRHRRSRREVIQNARLQEEGLSC